MATINRIYYKTDTNVEKMNLGLVGQFINSHLLLAYEVANTPEQKIWIIDEQLHLIKLFEISDVMPSYQKLRELLSSQEMPNGIELKTNDGKIFRLMKPLQQDIDDEFVYSVVETEVVPEGVKELELLDHLLDKIKISGFKSLDQWEKKKIDILSKNIKEL